MPFAFFNGTANSFYTQDVFKRSPYCKQLEKVQSLTSPSIS